MIIPQNDKKENRNHLSKNAYYWTFVGKNFVISREYYQFWFAFLVDTEITQKVEPTIFFISLRITKKPKKC